MSDYEKVVKEIRKQIQQPENQLRPITEATGLRILDGIYILIGVLHQQKADGAEKTIRNPDE